MVVATALGEEGVPGAFLPSCEVVTMAETWRLLVVDEDSEIRDVVEDLLFERGFVVHQAADVEQAVREMRKSSFEVLLCHLTLLQSLRDHLSRCTPAILLPSRVVAMSASGARAASDRASANLSKPFTRQRLLDALRGT